MNTVFAASSSKSKTIEAPLFPRGYVLPFALVILLFFLWGMSNNLTDILVQQFRKAFELSPLEAQLVQTAVFVGYFCVALPMATLMKRWGYKVGMLCGLLLFGIGTLMFWPAAVMNRYDMMLAALFLVGCGSAALETAANPFIAEAGPAETSERRLNLAQAFNPAGAITGILVGTFFIFSGVELPNGRVLAMKADGSYYAYLHAELMRVVPTYVTLACVVMLLTLVLAFVKLPFSAPLDEEPQQALLLELLSLLRLRQMQAAIFAQFCYCGAQVGTWSAFIPYLKQYTHTSERGAGLLLTGNLIALTLGRFASTALMRWVRPARMMALYGLINLILVALAVLYPGFTGAAALVATSFFMSIMFPTIFAMGIKGLGAKTKVAGSLLVMSVVGGAIIPPLLGWIARCTESYAAGYTVIAACYITVWLYGLLNSKNAVAIVSAAF